MAGETRVTEAPVLALDGGEASAKITDAPVMVLGAFQAPADLTDLPVLVLSVYPVPAAVAEAPILVIGDAARFNEILELPLLVIARKVPCHMKRAQLWKITRTDGTVFGFTDHDEAVSFGGTTYSPCDSLNASALELAAMLGTIGNLTLGGVISDDAITEEDLLAGKFDGAEIEIWEAPWDDDTGETPRRLAVGTAGSMNAGAKGFEFEVLTPGGKLQQKALLQTYTAGCRFDLGDSRCTINLAALTVSGAVTAVTVGSALVAARRRMFRDTSRTEADGYFDQGKLTWTSGANIGVSSEIKSFVGDDFILWDRMLHPIQIGDAYTATPGCDKLAETCKDKFDNFINFGGFDKLPGRDAIAQTPDAKG